MSARYYFKFVAVQADGDIYDNDSPDDKQPSLRALGQEGWHVVGVLSESAVTGYGHTLILQQRTEVEWDGHVEEWLESSAT
jgi:hypothetical protein